MTATDYIATARDLAGANSAAKPRETNLRRAVSTTYYAIFHCMAAFGADLLAGDSSADRNNSAWRQAYRALDHGNAKTRCESAEIARFPVAIRNLAKSFIAMQKKRHYADYDPATTYNGKSVTKSAVVQDIRNAETVIRHVGSVSKKDLRAFAIFVLLKHRKD